MSLRIHPHCLSSSNSWFYDCIFFCDSAEINFMSGALRKNPKNYWFSFLVRCSTERVYWILRSFNEPIITHSHFVFCRWEKFIRLFIFASTKKSFFSCLFYKMSKWVRKLLLVLLKLFLFSWELFAI